MAALRGMASLGAQSPLHKDESGSDTRSDAAIFSSLPVVVSPLRTAGEVDSAREIMPSPKSRSAQFARSSRSRSAYPHARHNERELIRERSQAGREVARAAGRLGGRPSKLTAEKRAAALAMRERGDLTMTQIARAFDVGRSTLYQHLDLAERAVGAEGERAA
jgi:transposase-like protein